MSPTVSAMTSKAAHALPGSSGADPDLSGSVPGPSRTVPALRRIRHLIAALLVGFAAFALAPDRVQAQAVSTILSGIREGGGWVGIPIEGGEGSYSTVRLPSARMTLDGCVHVWYGHSGQWTIEARDVLTDSTLVLRAEPGIAVPFSHTFGMQTKLDFDFRWSEPRDTTLMLWIGVDMDGEGGDPPVCNPY